MQILTWLTDFLTFYVRAAALSRRLDDGRLTPEQQVAAVRALLADSEPRAIPRGRMAAQPA